MVRRRSWAIHVVRSLRRRRDYNHRVTNPAHPEGSEKSRWLGARSDCFAVHGTGVCARNLRQSDSWFSLASATA